MRGSSTVSCGMPDFTRSLLDTWFSKVTCWLLHLTKLNKELTRQYIPHTHTSHSQAK